MSKSILITGATGKQGGALISALSSRPNNPFRIYALTRNPTSLSAQRLVKTYPAITLVRGDFSRPADIFSQVPTPHSLFLMTNPMSAAREEAQGKAMVQAARASGVQHIVFTATDRGPDADDDPTAVPHFASKFRIEREIARHEGAWRWTFLRPVAFYENLTDDFLGRAFVGMWKLNGEEAKLKMVGTRDIGRIAADAVLSGEDDKFRNAAVDVVGDEISLKDARVVFKEVVGKEMAETGSVVSRTLKWVLHEQVGIMFNWFRETGFGADLKKMKTEYPFVMDFRSWLVEESAWRKQ